MSGKWRAGDANTKNAIVFRDFRAIGVTDYLTNGGKLEIARATPTPRLAASATAETMTSTSAKSNASGGLAPRMRIP
jgi:hypothetical protein